MFPTPHPKSILLVHLQAFELVTGLRLVYQTWISKLWCGCCSVVTGMFASLVRCLVERVFLSFFSSVSGNTRQGSDYVFVEKDTETFSIQFCCCQVGHVQPYLAVTGCLFRLPDCEYWLLLFLIWTANTVIPRIMTFRSTTDHIYDGDPIIL